MIFTKQQYQQLRDNHEVRTENRETCDDLGPIVKLADLRSPHEMLVFDLDASGVATVLNADGSGSVDVERMSLKGTPVAISGAPFAQDRDFNREVPLRAYLSESRRAGRIVNPI